MEMQNSAILVMNMFDALIVLITLEMCNDLDMENIDVQTVKRSFATQLIHSAGKQFVKFELTDLINLIALLTVLNEVYLNNPMLDRLIHNFEIQLTLNTTAEQFQDAMDQCALRDLLNSAGI